MRYKVSMPTRNSKECSCVECKQKDFREKFILEGCIEHFTENMKGKLIQKFHDGARGWDDEEWSLDEIKEQIIKHIEKGDFVDVANFAMFAWNRDL